MKRRSIIRSIFGTTDHRYIIAYHYANGWQETKSILIPGFAKNHCMVINKGHRRSLSLIPQQTLSILVKGQLLAQKRNPSHCEKRKTLMMEQRKL